ncbi:hypothetical protein Lalb_Chr03g0038171 [Lupinus albus]|uniref:Uncharacterized protein n=1 Tax=Lupinus albus TaxID=3870 RepID=A0A6A4QWU4_LUPAL|nr:hypothetical protein Lalb_Chr03g0038171 [Lupinus albus]
MDYSVGDYEILETSIEVKQNTNGNVQEKDSTNASQSEQKGRIPLTSQPEPKSEVDPFYVEKVSQIKMNLYRLYDEYVNKDDQSNESLSQVQGLSSLGGEKGKKFQVPLYQARVS